MKDRITFGAMIATECDNHGHLVSTPREQKIAAAAAIHDELHEWCEQHFPFGSGAELSQEHLRRGMKDVRHKISKLSDAETQERFGVPLLLILGMIPTLVSWISMIWKWWSRAKVEEGQ